MFFDIVMKFIQCYGKFRFYNYNFACYLEKRKRANNPTFTYYYYLLQVKLIIKFT